MESHSLRQTLRRFPIRGGASLGLYHFLKLVTYRPTLSKFRGGAVKKTPCNPITSTLFLYYFVRKYQLKTPTFLAKIIFTHIATQKHQLSLRNFLLKNFHPININLSGIIFFAVTLELANIKHRSCKITWTLVTKLIP